MRQVTQVSAHSLFMYAIDVVLILNMAYCCASPFVLAFFQDDVNAWGSQHKGLLLSIALTEVFVNLFVAIPWIVYRYRGKMNNYAQNHRDQFVATARLSGVVIPVLFFALPLSIYLVIRMISYYSR